MTVIWKFPVILLMALFLLAPTCTLERTQPGTCEDGVLNNFETIIDCGGPNCIPCLTECASPQDCLSQVCLDGICQEPHCGDGLVNGDEDCDTETATAECDSDCTFALCGDGLLNELNAEECDDANQSNGDACLASCAAASCGDGFIETDVEQCDDGASNSDTLSDACRTNCTLPLCGDGTADSNEACDDGNNNDESACDYGTATCLQCNSDCSQEISLTGSYCGDGTLDLTAGEICDDGNTQSETQCEYGTATCSHCNSDCTSALELIGAFCGDGEVNISDGEVCDEMLDTLFCDGDCTDVVCGDGWTNSAVNESCDDSGESETCDTDCTIMECGDGFINSSAGELCDDGAGSTRCDLECAAAECDDGFYGNGMDCLEWTVCDVLQWESVVPTGTTNRECTPLTTCSDAEYEGTAPTATSDRICVTLTECLPGAYVSTAATMTTDRICSACTADVSYSATHNATSCTELTTCDALEIDCDATSIPVVPELSPLGPAGRPASAQLPTAYTNNEQWPLVILMHGYMQRTYNPYSSSGWSDTRTWVDEYFKVSERVDPDGFILVKPTATQNPDYYMFWNASNWCCDFHNQQPDDVVYLRGIIEEAQTRYAVDPSRIYVMGHSNGGFMSYRMACESADLIAGIMAFAGTTEVEPMDCPDTGPATILHVHGDNDETILYEGTADYPGAAETVERWKIRNNCESDFALQPAIDIVSNMSATETSVEEASACDEETSVALWTINGGTHSNWYWGGFQWSVGTLFSNNYMTEVLHYLFERPKQNPACGGGSEYEETGPTVASDRMCTLLTDCLPGEYISISATATSDRVCASCTLGVNYSTSPNTESCTAVSSCSAAQDETAAPTLTTDRECDNS